MKRRQTQATVGGSNFLPLVRRFSEQRPIPRVGRFFFALSPRNWQGVFCGRKDGYDIAADIPMVIVRESEDETKNVEVVVGLCIASIRPLGGNWLDCGSAEYCLYLHG